MVGCGFEITKKALYNFRVFFFSCQRPGDAVDEVPTDGLGEEAVGTGLRVL